MRDFQRVMPEAVITLGGDPGGGIARRISSGMVEHTGSHSPAPKSVRFDQSVDGMDSWKTLPGHLGPGSKLEMET